MNDERSERIPQEGDGREASVGSLLASASALARRVLGSVQALAGTTACKGVQINELIAWSKEHHCWIEDAKTLGDYSDRGSENEVYLDFDKAIVYKLNDFRYSDDNLMPFYRIKIHNHYFPDCHYELIGFSKNSDGKTCAVLTQPFIVSEREATTEEIRQELEELGFLPQMDGEYFSNGLYDIFDATPGNVLKGVDGHLYFIDTIIYRSDDSNLSTYYSQSPKFSGKKH